MPERRGAYTREEILGQVAAWQATLQALREQEKVLWDFSRKPFEQVIFSGCGSTHFLSLAGAAVFQALTGVPTRALPASEILIFPEVYLAQGADVLLVAVSRSGETTETVEAVRTFRRHGGREVMAITCYEDSTLAREASISPPIREAHEESIAQTRSFSTMFLTVQVVSALWAGREDLLSEAQALPAHGERLIARQHELGRELGESPDFERFFFLGSSFNYGLACEAMLKMKEMTLSYSEAFYFLEFRHGPKSMVNERTLVSGLLSDSGREYEMEVLKEMQGLGAKTLALAERADLEGMDFLLPLESGLSEVLRSVLYMPLLQILAYYRSMSKGLDPDRPKNLDAVVKI
jgi:glucosamine--fructose-6-phosphate aminotransferase (isomerizing)